MKKLMNVFLGFTFLTSLSYAADDDLLQFFKKNQIGNTHVIVDLDETVIDSTPRRFKAYQEVVTRGAMHGLGLMDFYTATNRYDLFNLLRRQAHLAGTEGCERLRREDCDDYGCTEWCDDILSAPELETKIIQRYLAPDLMVHDLPIPGAVHFIRGLTRRQATVWFVSARPIRTLRDTLVSLARLELIPSPTNLAASRVRLAAEKESTLDFKRRVTQEIENLARSQNSKVSLVIENEPENLDVMLQAAPGAQGIYVEGATINPKHPVPNGALRVKDFL